MWTKASNSESQKPPEVSVDASGVIVTRNHRRIHATEEMPEHWEYEEWQMTREQYEIYAAMTADLDDTAAAICELAALVIGE